VFVVQRSCSRALAGTGQYKGRTLQRAASPTLPFLSAERAGLLERGRDRGGVYRPATSFPRQRLSPPKPPHPDHRTKSRSIRANGHHTITIRMQIPIVPRKDFFRRIQTTQPMSEQRTTTLRNPSPFPPHVEPRKAPRAIETTVPVISTSKLRDAGGPVGSFGISETRGDAHRFVSDSATGGLASGAAISPACDVTDHGAATIDCPLPKRRTSPLPCIGLFVA